MKSYIKGNVSRLLFEKDTTNYKVGIFKVKETNDSSMKEYKNKSITFTGEFLKLNTEETYILYGELIKHPKYDMQYKVETYEVCLPDTDDGIISYLSSDLFKGIGLFTAKKIVNMFGKNTIKEIKEENPLLYTIKGVKEEKIKRLIKLIKENSKNEDQILKLNELGFTNKESLSLVSKYKDNINYLINENIYLLVNDIEFEKLDNIFLKNNEERNPLRIHATIKYLISKICYEKGDTLVSKEDLYLNLNKHFKEIITSEEYFKYLEEMNKTNEIIIINNYIELQEFYETEVYIKNKINTLNKEVKISKEKIINIIDKFEKENSISLNDEQKASVIGSILNNVYIITGGPGTGKTLVIKVIVNVLKEINNEDITLLAPTGRSAKRMMENIYNSAYTIHKFLKWNKETKTFQLNENNKSDSKYVIVDESSMVDIFLMRSLLESLKDNTKLILVGDAFQLPSIAPGNVLSDLINVKSIKRTKLNKIYRTSEDSYIVELANNIKNKKKIDLNKKYNDFTFIECDEDYIKKSLCDVCLCLINKKIDINEVQILAPMYKGQNGIDMLNIVMQEIFNPPSLNKNEISIRGITYREKDKVIQLINDVDNNIYNGDIGFIKNITTDKKPTLTVDYNGNLVTYNQNKFDEITHAYAISVHKSQGSEYDYVIVIISNSFKRMLFNKLIYTAVSRSKKGLVIIGKSSILEYAINKEYASNRKTMLKDLF